MSAKISDKDKKDILLSLLSERYNASHKMRERSLSFAIWILGFGVAMVWLLLAGISLTGPQKIILTVFVVVVLALTNYFLCAIEKGFIHNKKIMVNIEQALGCYEKGAYDNSKALFPREYAGDYEHLSKLRRFLRILDTHFVSIYIWTTVIALMIISLIWLSPNQLKN